MSEYRVRAPGGHSERVSGRLLIGLRDETLVIAIQPRKIGAPTWMVPTDWMVVEKGGAVKYHPARDHDRMLAELRAARTAETTAKAPLRPWRDVVEWADGPPTAEGVFGVLLRENGRAAGHLEVQRFPEGLRCWVDGKWRSIWDVVAWNDNDGTPFYYRTGEDE